MKIQSTEVLSMKIKDEKHFLTIDRNEINSYIECVMVARNAYLGEGKPIELINDLLNRLMKLKRKLHA
jgi:hypothetical protein